MTRTQLTIGLTILLGVALLAFIAPAAAAGAADDGTITVEGEGETDSAQPGTFDIALEPTDGEAPPGGTLTYEVVILDATNGLEAYDNIEIVVGDDSVGQFVDFEETRETDFSKSEIRNEAGENVSEGPVLWLESALADEAFDGADEIVLAEVDLEALGEVGETTDLTISETVEDGEPPAIQNLDENVQVADERFHATVTMTNFAVDIVETNTPVAGDDLEVQVDIENMADIEATEEVTLTTEPDIGTDSTELTLGGGESTVETLSVSTGTDEAGDYTVTVASDHSTDSTDVTVLDEPGFAVDVLDTNEPVEGEDIEVQFEVENVDDVQDTQDIVLTTDPDIGTATTDVTLDAGESTVESLSVPTAVGEAGDYTVTVTSENDDDSAAVSVLQEASFAVGITDVDEDVAEGDTLTFNATVENTGEVQDTQDIIFTVDGEQEDIVTDMTVTAGATVLEEFTYDVEIGDAPEIEIAVASDDDTATQTVPVDEPAAFLVSITGFDENVTEGEFIAVDYEVTNTGDAEDTQDITFEVDDEIEDIEFDLTLEGGETHSGEFVHQTEVGDAPGVNVTVASEDDTDTETVPLDAVPFFAVTITDIDDEVVEGEEMTVAYEIENTGDVEGTQDITFDVDGDHQSTEADVTLDGGETFTGTFTHETEAGDAPGLDVTVASDDDTDTASVSILEPPFFDVQITFIDKQVTAGETLSVEYAVTNTGDATGTQDIDLEINGSVESTNAGVTVAAGETVSDELTYETDSDDVPEIEATVASDNDTATETVPVQEAPFFAVTITDIDEEVAEGDEITVDYEIENTGDVGETQDITLAVDGTHQGTEADVTLDGGETFTGTFTHETEPGDAPEIGVTVASDDDTDSDTVTVNDGPFFEATITAVDEAVVEGETLTVDYEIENTGGLEDTQDITFEVDGTQQSTEADVTLDTGESFTGTFTHETESGDAPLVEVTVASEHHADSETVAVSKPAFFGVTITAVDEAVAEGETVTVDYEIENTGDSQDTQEITFEVDGTQQATETDVTLDSDETFTGAFTYDTDSDDVPEISATVASDDDAATETVAVNEEAFFDVSLTDVDNEVPEGTEVEVSYEIENTGGAEETQDITFEVDDELEDSETVTLDGGETFTGSFVYASEQGDAPEIEVTVASDDDDASETVSLTDEDVFAVVITAFDETVVQGETLTVDYEITNTGDEEDTQDITVTVDGNLEDTVENVTLGGGETFTGAFTYDTDSNDVPEVAVTVASEDDTADRTVTVDEPALFAVTITEAEAVVEGETVTVAYEIENTGGLEDSQDITFDVDGTQQATEAGVTLDGDETFTGAFTYDTDSEDVPEISVTVASDDDAATETVAVNEEAFFDVTLTDVDDGVPEGTEVEVSYEIENTGGAEDTQDILFEVDDSLEDSETVTLGGGETFTGSFVYASEEGDAPEIEVTVASDDDAASETVSLTEDDIFAVSITAFDEAVVEGETLTVDYEVTNTGEVQDSQEITFEVDGTVEDTVQDVSLGGGDSFAGTFTYDTDSDDVPEISVTVASEDDTADRTVTVDEPALFAVTITEAEAVAEGETLTVAYEIENTGGLEDSQDITFDVDGDHQSTEADVTLDGGETVTGTFTYDTDSEDVPELDVTVASDDDTATETVTVLSLAAPELDGLDIAGQGDDAMVSEGENEDVTVEVTNVGDLASEFTVALDIGDGEVQRAELTDELATGETETVTFANVTGDLTTFEYDVTVTVDDESVTGTLLVEDSGTALLDNIDIAGEGDSAFIAGGDAEDVTATVTNIGGQTEEFNVTLGFEDESGTVVVEETQTATVAPGDSSPVTFAGGTEDVPSAVPNYTVVVSADEGSIEGELRAWPDVTGDGNPATDTTGDMLLNDIRGDDEFSIFDVQELFNNFNDPVVQNTPAAFNFNDDPDESVSIFDVQSLFNQLAAAD